VTAPGASAPDDEGWLRLHPLTPLLRGGRFAAVAVVVLLQQGLRAESALAGLAVVVGVVPLVAAAAWVSWRAMRYRLTATELQVDSGVLTRRQRRVPLARLQSVDVVRPFLARVLGLAELRLEVAGGGDTEAPLSYLSETDAQRLRARLLELAAGRQDRAHVADGAAGVEPPELPLAAVPTGPLVASALLGAPVWTVLVLVVLLTATALVDTGALAAVGVGFVPLVLGAVTSAGRRVLVEHGFRLAESPDGLRIRHGLLETRSATIPPDRVQLVRVREPVLWRPFGWVRVEVDVAGYGAGGDEQLTTSALLPVAPKPLAVALVARVLGGALPPLVAPAPPRARWRAPLQHPRLRLGLDARHLVSSYGVVTTTLDVVPLRKVQSLRLHQGPLQRRLRLASLSVDTAGRRIPGTVALHRDAEEARQLLLELTARARAQRASR
jgi:putative membrane protein